MNYIFKIIIIFCLLLFQTNTNAQKEQLSAKVHFGYSRPIGIDFSYAFWSYEAEGVGSQGVYVAYNRLLKRNSIEAKIGIMKLGYVTRQYQGTTPNPNFPNITEETNILEKSTFQLLYLDNAIGYALRLNENMNIKASLHYSFNVISILRNDYMFTEDNIPDHIIARETRRINLKDIQKKFRHHPSVSLELEHKLGKNLSVGLNYFLGLREPNPFMLYDRYYDRFNQNFSIFAAYTFRRF